MSPYTPGPWVARRAAKPDNTGGYDWAIVAPGKAIIAECFEHVDWRDPGVTYDVRPAEAHARLFAAAPELLQALHEGRRAIGDHFAPNDCYATGPLTGDPIRDLVQCPACSFIAMYDSAISRAATPSDLADEEGI